MKFSKKSLNNSPVRYSTTFLILLLLLLLQKQQSTVTSATHISLRSQETQIVQHFRAQRPSSLNGTLHHIQLIFTALVTGKESDNKNDCIMPKVLPALEVAIEHVQQLGFPNTLIDVTLISRDTFCSAIYGPIGFFEIYTNWSHVDAVFGLPCEYVLAPISRYAGVWQIPVISSGGNAAEFEIKTDKYPTLTRIEVSNWGSVVHAIVDSFNWTRTALIYENEFTKTAHSVCLFCMAMIHKKIERMSVVQQAFDKESLHRDKIAQMLIALSKQVRSKYYIS